LNVGIIGLGVGEQHIYGYALNKNCCVTSLCDIDQKKLAAVAFRHSIPRLTVNPIEILEDPSIDVVSIATYDDVHASQILTALANGKHIFVEKPLCLTSEEFDQIYDAHLQRPDLCISSNLILRTAPRFIQLKDRISSNKLGEIYFLESSYDYGRIHKLISGWRGDIPNYSVMHGGGIHLIDLFLWLTEFEVKTVTGVSTKIATRNSNFKGPDAITANLEFSNGSIGVVTSNYPSVIPHGHRLALYGTNGTFHHGPLGAAYFWERDPKAHHELLSDEYPGTSKGAMIPSFIDHIIDRNSPSMVSEKDVFNAMSVSLAIEKSISTNSTVTVNHY